MIFSFFKNIPKFLKIEQITTVSFQEFLDKGGKLMILMGEGGEQEFDTNVNFLLEDYGMSINNGSF